MTVSALTALTAAQRRHFAKVLHEHRADATQHLTRLRESIDAVKTARSDASADDEHDPEGPTMSQEWSSLTGLVSEAERNVAVIDTALARVDAGTYGTCIRCGGPIGHDRLEARPAADLCIECARAGR